MALSDRVINRLNTVLNRVGPADRTVYKRTITRTGGDDLIGRPGSVSYLDTVLSPQPVYQRLARFLVGPTAKAEEIVDVGTGQRRIGDEWMLILSPTAMSLADLENENVQIVFKDASGASEVFEITDFEPIPLTGADVAFIAYVKSIKRP